VKRNSWRMGIAGMVLGLGLGSAALAHEGEAKGQSVSVQGEIVCLTCLMSHAETATGAGHAKCAESCIAKGLPIGFKAADGDVFILLGEGHDPLKAKVAKLVGVPVTVTGVIVEQGGTKAIQVHDVKKGPAPAAPAAAAAVSPAPKPAAATTAVVWTCPMDGGTFDKPGKCPKCGMDLTKKE